MTTVTLHNLANTQPTPVGMRNAQRCSYRKGAGLARPWSIKIFFEAALPACGSSDPSQEAFS